jgi:uncharacterized protein (TIGR02996 family)
MTDDESFIRAIQASPLERTTRLVYADWLNERDDPRAGFLRAQCALLDAWHKVIESQPSLPNEWFRQIDLFNHVFALPVVRPGELLPFSADLEDAFRDGATVTKISVHAGQRLVASDVLLAVDTLIAGVEIEAQHDGLVLAVLVQVGQRITFNTPLVLLLKA